MIDPNIDPNTIIRARDMNKVQRDILAIVYKQIKNLPQSKDFQDFDQVIFYSGRRFRIRMRYKHSDWFLTILKFEHEEEEGVIIKPKYINR